MNKFLKIFIIIFSAGLALAPFAANAATVSLTSEKSIYSLGENILVRLILDTSGKTVNAIEGEIKVSSDFFDIFAIRTGSSFLTLWPRRPKSDSFGNIKFTGGVPNGRSGQNLVILDLALKAKKSGNPIISVSKATILLNDGFATELTGVEFIPLTLQILAQQSVSNEDLFQDNIAPEDFTPTISRSSLVDKNRYFVSFSAIDRESGISYYQVKEDFVLFPYFITWFSTGWKNSETPYITTLQHWWSKIYIRAYDFSGNYRQEIILKPIDDIGIIILCILGVALLIILIFILKRIYYAKLKK